MESMRSATISDRTVLPLGQEIAHGTIQGTGHLDRFPGARDQRGTTLNLKHVGRRVLQDKFTGVLDRKITDLIGVRLGQIDQLFDVVLHGYFLRVHAAMRS